MILVIGDVMIDHYLKAISTRENPEVSGNRSRIIEIDGMRGERRLGGAANVAARIRNYGADVAVISVVGPGSEGAELIRQFKTHADYVIRDDARKTTVKTRVFKGSDQLVRLDVESHNMLPDYMEERIADAIRDRVLGTTDVVVISDYGKGVVTDKVCRIAIDYANARNIPVIVDPKRQDFTIYRGATVITPNDTELAATGESPVMLSMLTGAAILHKRGAQGMCLYDRGRNGIPGEFLAKIPAPDVKPVDLTGAGDAVVASLAVSLSNGISLLEAAYGASHAAGLAITEFGTARIW